MERPTPHFATFIAYLFFVIVAMPILYDFSSTDRPLDLILWGMMVVGTWSLFPTARARVAAGILITLMLMLHISLNLEFNYKRQILWLVIHILFVILMLWATAKWVVLAEVVDKNILGAAACSYLLFGILMALVFSLISAANPEAFKGEPTEVTMHPLVGGHILTFLYYSFVTLTTLGYGDIVPISAAARSLSMAEAIVGQLFIALILGYLVSLRVHAEIAAKNK
jgi:hypothetical protein